MPLAHVSDDPDGFWADPAVRPCLRNDIEVGKAARQKVATVREAVYSELIPPWTYAVSNKGRRVYRQIDLRKHFGLPLEGELQLDGPLW